MYRNTRNFGIVKRYLFLEQRKPHRQCGQEQNLYNLNRNKFLGPHIKNIKVEFMLIFLFNNLDSKRPLWWTSVLNSFIKTLSVRIWKKN
jgi:hypothetical protein